MGETRLQRDARLRARDLRRATGEAIRRLREDEALTKAVVAAAAGVDRSYITRLESGDREASLQVLASIAAVLGADLSLRLYPTTGPRIRDRIQAAMGEAMLRVLHARWSSAPEVPVLRPARGVIDFVLAEQRPPRLVATEIHSEIRRLEQQVRWHREKELSLPSSTLWQAPGPARPEPGTSRLLVLRSSASLIELARTFEATLRAAYPARTADVVAALTTADASWPGPGIVWVRVAGSDVRLLDAPPRTVLVGR